MSLQREIAGGRKKVGKRKVQVLFSIRSFGVNAQAAKAREEKKLWAQCDLCDKWRCLANGTAAPKDDEKFQCSNVRVRFLTRSEY